ncbi:hypothetical protein KVR01_000791 [Diaporthe batatas]|uniref:uncharacterized protein n=1 Tax=Diaporthe batatas TaxID=748121 RepID=UPI001D04C5AC|nr:uncharacterized protein KVR01_000791 [Diaporthe batatas]KAG8170046.1 hypothetical protein KVR01_000791 [Diaporthe batatas]
MPSSKGKPTDPELREEIKEGKFSPSQWQSNSILGLQEPNKSGGGEGQWSAWKASKLAKEYEKQGGGYENEPGSKNEPKKGEPEPKSDSKKKKETED